MPGPGIAQGESVAAAVEAGDLDPDQLAQHRVDRALARERAAEGGERLEHGRALGVGARARRGARLALGVLAQVPDLLVDLVDTERLDPRHRRLLVLDGHSGMKAQSAGDAGGDRDLHEQLGRIQRGHGHGGPRRLVRREVLRVLLVVGRELLHPCQVRGRRQHVVERRAGRGQDQLDALQDVAGLLAHVLAELPGDRVPPRLAGDEDEVAESRRRRQVGVRLRRVGVDDLFLGHGRPPAWCALVAGDYNAAAEGSTNGQGHPDRGDEHRPGRRGRVPRLVRHRAPAGAAARARFSLVPALDRGAGRPGLRGNLRPPGALRDDEPGLSGHRRREPVAVVEARHRPGRAPHALRGRADPAGGSAAARQRRRAVAQRREPRAPDPSPVPPAARPGAFGATARELGRALEDVGFFVIVNHGVPQPLIDRTFAEARRFHAQPMDAKLALRMNEHNNGYMMLGRYAVWTSDVNANDKPDLNEAFFVKRERGPDDPLVRAGRRFAGPNQWPQNLPGFRESVLAYTDTVDALGRRLLPLCAAALDLPTDTFDRAFAESQFSFRLTHYPPVAAEANQFGIAPHTDANFMTLLAQSEVPGLQVRMPDGTWVDVPYE